MCPGRTDPSASGPARSRPAPPPCFGPPRTAPPAVCPGFGFDKYKIEFKIRTYHRWAGAAYGWAARRRGRVKRGRVGRSSAGRAGRPAGRFPKRTTFPFRRQGTKDDSPGSIFGSTTNEISLVDSNTQTYVPRAGRGGAAPGWAAGRGGDGQDGTPTDRFDQNTTDLLTFETTEENRKKTVLGMSLEASTYEPPFKPIEEQNQRLNRGTTAALRAWLLTNVPMHICLCTLHVNLFVQGMSGIFPDMPCMKRVYRDK